MVLEVAILNLRVGASAEFEKAFSVAQRIISSISGYQRHELRRCAEHDAQYLLLVWWDSIESHTKGFRESSEYQEWKSLLHHFYEPFPQVEHYLPIPGLAG
jgi:heme-degrading monooxygenase HmoA